MTQLDINELYFDLLRRKALKQLPIKTDEEQKQTNEVLKAANDYMMYGILPEGYSEQ